MKLHLPAITALVLPLAAASLLSSCVSDDGVYTSRGGYATYASLPPNYSGTSYYYNNRYYAGGRYETGRYSYGGRTFQNRYFHNGQYIYGGEYRQYPVSRAPQRQFVPTAPPRGGVSVTYTTLPRGYTGSSYQHNNRYYSGGQYETGRYSNGGRSYNSRYNHNGQYVYGGVQRHY